MTETDSSCPDSSCPRRRLKHRGTRCTVGSTAHLCPTLSGHWHRIRPSSTRYHRNGRTRSLRPMCRLSMSALVRTTQGRRRRGKEEASAALPPSWPRCRDEAPPEKHAAAPQPAVMLSSTFCRLEPCVDEWLSGTTRRDGGQKSHVCKMAEQRARWSVQWPAACLLCATVQIYIPNQHAHVHACHVSLVAFCSVCA